MSNNPTSKSKILLIEDTENTIELIKETLGEDNFEIYDFKNGMRAYEEASKIIPDLILLDILLPGINGFDICKNLKQHNNTKHIPVIFLSALNSISDKVKGFEAGGIDYITKPIETEELLARVNSQITIINLRKELDNQTLIYAQHLEQTNLELQKFNDELIAKSQIIAEREEQYRNLIELIPDGFIIHIDGIIEFINKAAINLAKANNIDEVIGKPIINFVHPDSQPVVFERIKQIMRDNVITPMIEIKLNGLDGNVYEFEVTGSPIIYKNKKGILTILRDISERNKAIKALYESEEKYRYIANNITDVVWIFDTFSDKFIYVSPSSIKLSGFTPEETLLLSMSQLLTPKSYEIYKQIVEIRLPLFIENPEEQFIYYDELEMNCKDGKIINVEISSYFYMDRKNSKICSMGSTRDITKRRKAENALKLSEERYRHITNSITDYIYKVYLKNEKSYKTIHGEASFAITGYHPEEFDKDTFLWFKIIHESDRKAFKEFLESVFKRKEDNTIEHRIYHKNGSVRWIKNTIVLFKDSENNITEYNGVIRDITERKNLEQQVINSIIKTEEAERSRFAKDLHDGLGPVLSTLKMFIEWLSVPTRKDDKQEILKEALKTAEEAIISVKEISNNLSPHILAKFGLYTALKSFCQRLNETHKISIDLKFEDTSRLPENIEITLYRVLIESINNTCKHSGATKITIEFQKTEDKLNVRYSDNGSGFDLEQVLNKKTGLGLYNIQNRIKSIGGNIEIKSEQNSGTQIKITIDF